MRLFQVLQDEDQYDDAEQGGDDEADPGVAA